MLETVWNTSMKARLDDVMKRARGFASAHVLRSKTRSLMIGLGVSWSLALSACAAKPDDLLQHSLKVTEDGASFEYKGHPFFYVGDTAWEIFHRLDRDAVIEYLDDRQAKGFTVVQAVVIAELDGVRTPNAYGHLPFVDFDPTQPNEAYFEHVDFVVEEANARGMFVAMLPTWGDKVPNVSGGLGPVVFNVDNAGVYGRFLGERYRRNDIVWMLGGDRNPTAPGAKEIWRAMATGLRAGDQGRHLITYHPKGGRASAEWFHNETWLDFNTYQSGHDRPYTEVYEFAERLAKRTPRKPFFDAEPAYEDIPYRFWEFFNPSRPIKGQFPEGTVDAAGRIQDRAPFPYGFADAHDVRVHTYWNMLAGAAGHVYGNNAIWQMTEPGKPPALPYLVDWREALNRPGAEDVTHLVTLNSMRAFSDFDPAQEIISDGQSGGRLHIRAARSVDGTTLMAYLSQGQAVGLGEVPEPPIRGDAVGLWFNPDDGSARPLQEEIQVGAIYTPPSSGEKRDWILILDSSGAYAALAEAAEEFEAEDDVSPPASDAVSTDAEDASDAAPE